MWDVVLRGGRVIDPESGLDVTADVAIAGDRVARIGTGLGPGQAELDLTGLVVTAGFVDLHSHVTDIAGLRLRATDGVTTALELEAGVTPVEGAYRRAAAEARPVNYGFAASWALARMKTIADVALDSTLNVFLANIARTDWQRPASEAETGAMLARLAADLADGALGIGVLLGYAPATGPDEYLQVARLAAQAGAPVFTHARDLVELTPATRMDGAEEIVRAAGETGAHMHYCHINSTSQRHIGRVLDLIGRAQAAGALVTTEAYPYGSGMTGIGASFLAPERLAERDLAPSSLTYVRTGEQVASVERLRELRRDDPGGLVIIQMLDEDRPADRELLMRSLTFPGAIVASDAMPLTWAGPSGLPPSRGLAAGPGPRAGEEPAGPLGWPLPPGAVTHPRTAGTFSRALRLLTRGGGPGLAAGPFSLPDALSACSLRPARLLQDLVPAMRRKGRITPGSDADIVVFDPAAITDRATYSDSTRPSAGIRHVLVNGTFVVHNDSVVADALPGRPVRATPG